MIVDQQRDSLLRLDIADVHKRLQKLPFVEDSKPSRYYRGPNDDLFVAWSWLKTGFPERLRLLAVKELPEASPAYEVAGSYKTAELGPTARWVAPTYCVIFPEKNLAGMIYSAEGPRPAQISDYLQDEAAIAAPSKIEFEALANPDIGKQLQRLKTIRKLELQYHPSTGPSLFRGQHSDLDSAMAALIDVREAATITITVNAGRKGGARLSELKDKLTDLIRRGPLLGSASKLVVTGPDQYTNKSLPVDLLTQVITATKTVPLAAGAKNLDEESAFSAIEEAYGEHLSQFPSVEISDA